MTATNATSPSTIATDSSYGSIDWVNPDNVKVSDDTYATINLEEVEESYYIKATNFGFSIPNGNRIDGIKVEIELYANSNQIVDRRSRIIKGGSISSTDVFRDPNTFWPEVEVYLTYGGESELWGQTLSVNDVNSSDFGFAFAIESFNNRRIGYIDHIRMTVYYSPINSPLPTFYQ